MPTLIQLINCYYRHFQMSASSSRKRISTREYPLCSKLPREMSGDRDSASSSTNSADSDAEHPRRLIPELYTHFYNLGWTTGSGGSVSIKDSDGDIYVAPSGVQKERIKPDDMFVFDIKGDQISCPDPSKNLRPSSCFPVFMNAYQKRNAGAVIHTHSPNAVMATLFWPGDEFRISNLQMIKAIANEEKGRNYRFDEELIIPIIENRAEEIGLKDPMGAVIDKYPETCAVLVRGHGLYMWGSTWQKAKIMCEALDYLFGIAVEMKKYGLDVSKKETMTDDALYIRLE
ncbi:probable methylthioribulose-1-phosphate dehydratase isoform X2 [Oscarella lobularis]|uniref:probable methylthioribulose-1-phosphate dehydratase isoform X2 n=1 Tax=Oscarella lobularis TaxID=121494 RepID=UPI0033137500